MLTNTELKLQWTLSLFVDHILYSMCILNEGEMMDYFEEYNEIALV